MSAADRARRGVREPLEAHEPPEARGAGRDDVRLLVAYRDDGRARRTRASPTCPTSSRAGDLLVSTRRRRCPPRSTPSAPAGRGARAAPVLARARRARRAALDRRAAPAGRRRDCPVVRRRARRARAAPRRRRRRRCSRRYRGCARGSGSPQLELRRAARRLPGASRRARSGTRYVDRDWPLDAYQTTYATEPGSAEMPSAGRPLTPELLTRARRARRPRRAGRAAHRASRRSSSHEPPYPERFRVPADDRAPRERRPRLGRARDRGRHDRRARARVRRRRTTARVRPGEGWTNLVVSPERGVASSTGC